jgi:hypothetical protein
MNRTRKRLIAPTLIVATLLAGACSGSGGGYRGHASHGIGYGHYYGPRPWGYYPGYIDVDPGPGIDDGPVATPLPEMGMPDLGGGMDMGMGMEMGGFDF